MMDVRGEEGERRVTEDWLSYPSEGKEAPHCVLLDSVFFSLSVRITHTQSLAETRCAASNHCGFILLCVEGGEVKEMDKNTHLLPGLSNQITHFHSPSMSLCITSLDYLFSHALTSVWPTAVVSELRYCDRMIILARRCCPSAVGFIVHLERTSECVTDGFKNCFSLPVVTI